MDCCRFVWHNQDWIRQPGSISTLAQPYSPALKAQSPRRTLPDTAGMGAKGTEAGASLPPEGARGSHRSEIQPVTRQRRSSLVHITCLPGLGEATITKDVRSQAGDVRWLSITCPGWTRAPQLSLTPGAPWQLPSYKTYSMNRLQEPGVQKDPLSSKSHEE